MADNESENEDILAKALAEGLWKEKLDVKTNRKYYVHSKTKKTTWNLRKDLEAEKTANEGKIIAAELHSQTADAEQHAQVLARVKSRAQIEAELQGNCDELMRRKRELVTELLEIKEPLMLEHKLLREVQRKIEHEQFLSAHLKADLSTVRDQHLRENEAMKDKISKFRSEVDAQKASAELRGLTHQKLTEEAERMRRETLHRRSGLDDLRLQIREAHSGLDGAKGKLVSKRLEVHQREQLLEERRTTLRECITQRSTFLSAVADTRRDIEIAEVAARRSSDMLAREGGNAVLRAEYERKMEFWRLLEGPLREVEDVEFMSKENDNLQRHLSRAREDEAALCRAVDVLKGELARSRHRVQALRRDSDRLEAECRGLIAEAAMREAAPAGTSVLLEL